jgi:hypothetical protein
MNTYKKLLLASGSISAGLSALAASHARAASITSLHMDINSVTISAFDSTGTTPVAFTGDAFTGQLQFGTNPDSTLATDIDGNPADGFTGEITGFTGDLQLTAGALTGGTVTVSVADGAATDSYTYNVVGGSGAVSRSPSAPVFNQLGYELAGDTNGGTFANSDFGGINVQTWVNDEPLSGDFFQFHYRPNGQGTDQGGDVELYVNGLSPAGGPTPTVALPMAASGGMLGFTVLGFFQWMRARRLNVSF